MRHARTRLSVGTMMLASLTTSIGCTHYHFYGTNGVPVCEAPAAAAGAQPVLVPQYGSVCEVPSSPGATVVSGAPGGTRVLVSQPQGPRRFLSGGGSRFAWRRPDPESLATTRVEGGRIDEPALR